MNPALVIGHPGHELRVHRFLEDLTPRVYILTDGSGFDKKSRVYNTRKILERAGCTLSEFAGVFSDREMYNLILNQDMAVLSKLVYDMAADMTKHKIDFVFGDAIEGFNPTHDLCRYLINAIVGELEMRSSTPVENFDFLLEGPPNTKNGQDQNDLLVKNLTEQELDRKIVSANCYPELKVDVKHALAKHGRGAFSVETLRRVTDRAELKGWDQVPFYEHHGFNQVKAGQYSEVITFKDHMEPLGRQLWQIAMPNGT